MAIDGFLSRMTMTNKALMALSISKTLKILTDPE
jgi:hypothetical protein